MKTRDTLIRRNQDLQQDLEKILHLVSTSKIVAELEPCRAALLQLTQKLLTTSKRNLAWLNTGQASLFPDILSETSTLLQLVRLLKFRYLRGLYRTSHWDRVCLQTIAWVHKQHPETVDCPPVFADDDISIIPFKDLPFYFFPCLEQRGLRFQPLFFHEFGHLLYSCHEQELDDLVGEFQQCVESELHPASQRNDQYAEAQAKVRQSVVETWYKWVQELFCDAIGLEIGGPSFLNAFSEYIGKFQAADYYRQPSDLHGSSHPVSWLRVQLLAERAERRGFVKDAERVLDNWRGIASLLHITEDHHGFYTDSLRPVLVGTLDDMLVEAAPRKCSGEEAAGKGWDREPLNLVSLLNRVWIQYFDNPAEFRTYETELLGEIYHLGKQP